MAGPVQVTAFGVVASWSDGDVVEVCCRRCLRRCLAGWTIVELSTDSWNCCSSTEGGGHVTFDISADHQTVDVEFANRPSPVSVN